MVLWQEQKCGCWRLAANGTESDKWAVPVDLRGSSQGQTLTCYLKRFEARAKHMYYGRLPYGSKDLDEQRRLQLHSDMFRTGVGEPIQRSDSRSDLQRAAE